MFGILPHRTASGPACPEAAMLQRLNDEPA
jgi:hypothetical protein